LGFWPEARDAIASLLRKNKNWLGIPAKDSIEEFNRELLALHPEIKSRTHGVGERALNNYKAKWRDLK